MSVPAVRLRRAARASHRVGTTALIAVPPVHECGLCGETMHLVERQTVERIPGTAQETTRTTWEWVCSECDNFEEAEKPTPDES